MPPGSPQNFDLNEVKAARLEIGKEKRDVTISGLGFTTIGPGVKVIACAPKNVDVVLRNSTL